MTIDVNTCRAQDKQSQLLLVYCSQTAGAQPLTTLAFCSYQPDDGVPRMQKVRSLLLGGIQICQELHSFKIKKIHKGLKRTPLLNETIEIICKFSEQIPLTRQWTETVRVQRNENG